MTRELAALACGLVFGAGLLVSGMTNPAKVLGFLDVAGTWDPTLAFVMGGALSVNAAAWALTRRRDRPLYGERFALPEERAIDRRLLAGAALFGIGWGLVGLCPGPALAGLLRGKLPVYLFVAAMLAGMLGAQLYTRRTRR
ncbi:MAG TPA: YeeE/YedE family protein [Myxococcota bacterium]|nr:YeeE/YedE family protein [Myxococcota bacterium]